MVVTLLLFVVLAMALTGALMPALLVSGWVLLVILGALLVGLIFHRLFFGAATSLAAMVDAFSAKPLRPPPHGYDAPKPGDPDWLDWANRRGRYASR